MLAPKGKLICMLRLPYHFICCRKLEMYEESIGVAIKEQRQTIFVVLYTIKKVPEYT